MRLEQGPLRPGGPLPEDQLYSPRTNSEGKEVGVATPDGTFFYFDQGEKLALVREDGGSERKPIVMLSDGKQVSFESWKDARKERFKGLFEAADEEYGDLYMTVLTDYPELAQMDVQTGDKEQYPVLEFTGGFWICPEDSNDAPVIVVNINDEEHYGHLISDRRRSVEVAARLLNIRFEDIERDPRILKLFIFLHEIGHAHDYIATYLNKWGPREAVVKNREKREEEMNSLPVPGHSSVSVKKLYRNGKLKEYFDMNKSYFEARGITSAEAVAHAQEDEYRTIGSEAYADNFAAEVLTKHWDEFGLGHI